jgi:hypothetical protein
MNKILNKIYHKNTIGKPYSKHHSISLDNIVKEEKIKKAF